MLIKECSFCETPSTGVNENGFCKVCARAFSILSDNEIRQIQDKVGFKRQTPDKEFARRQRD